jgi:uncharacterized membrane protein
MKRISLASQLSRASRVWLALLVLLAVLGLATVPWEASVPIHWSLDGQPDGFAPGWIAVLTPVAAGVLLLLLLLVIQRTGSDKDREAARSPYEATVSSILAFFLVLEGAIVHMGRGGELNMQPLMVASAGVLLIVVGNSLPKTRPSWQAGLPLRWTNNDPDLWRVTQRWFSRAHIMSGLFLITLAAVDLKGIPLLASILIAAFFPTLLALAVARRLGKVRKLDA